MSVKISVVIPCYNSSKYIETTLSSLEKQTLKPYEVICIDDGSTDETYDMLLKYAEDSKLCIKVIKQQNSGVSVARNRGIEISSGDVLLFLDSDDTYSSKLFEHIDRLFFAGCDTAFWSFSHDENCLFEGREESCEIIQRNKIEAFRIFMYKKNKYHTSAFFYSTNIVKKNNILFTKGAKYGEDWEFTSKYLCFSKSIAEIDAPMMFYRISEGSAMSSVTYNHIDAYKSALKTEKFLKRNDNKLYELFSGYMKHRAMFSVAHTFAKQSSKENFCRLKKEYDVRESMRVLSKNSAVGKGVKIAALSYLISPWFFYYITGKR